MEKKLKRRMTMGMAAAAQNAGGGGGEEEPTSFDYLILLSRTAGSMKVAYMMVDHEQHAIAPKVMQVKWPRFMDLVDFRACVVRNVLYVTGGREKSTGKYLKQMLKYDPLVGRWKECADMRKARAGHTACAIDGKVYVAGGSSSDKDILDLVESYEPVTDEWHKEESLLGARRDHGCVVKDSVMYLTGGVSRTEAANDNIWKFEKFYPDPKNPVDFDYVWSKYEEEDATPETFLKMRRELAKHAIYLFGSRVYVVGGVCNGYTLDGNTFIQSLEDVPDHKRKEAKRKVGTSDAVASYKFPKKLTPAEIRELEALQAAAEEEKKNPKKKKDQKHMYAPPYNPMSQGSQKKKPWQKNLPDLPKPRCGAGLYSLGHKIYMFGGHKIEEPDVSQNIVQFYHVKKEAWYTAFDLGEGDFRDVDVVMLNIPRTNKDFRPMRYSDCKWVMW